MYIKAFIKKGTEYVMSFNDRPYFTEKDYYTTVDVDESDIHNDHWIKHLAKANLSKRIAMSEFMDIRNWVNLWLDIADIQIVR